MIRSALNSMRLETSIAIGSLWGALLSGQSLSVPPSEVSLNAPSTFSVVLDVPPDRALLALQWDLSVPPVIATRTEDITIGKAAQAAGKSLTCALRPVKRASRRIRYTCILAGGRKPLSDGPVADVQYHAQWDHKGAPAQLEIENVLGVTEHLERVPMANVDVPIHIR